MLAARYPKAVSLGSRIGYLALATVLAIAACTSHLSLPVDVGYGKLSPRYTVSFVNETGAPFDILPSGDMKQPPASERVAPGGRFTAILQLRSFTVGSGSSVPGTQVFDSPYFEQAGADQAAVRFKQGETRSLLIALDHPSWFGESQGREAPPVELVVPVQKFSLMPLFPRGPQGGP